jgi:hypothetical protein
MKYIALAIGLSLGTIFSWAVWAIIDGNKHLDD